MTRPCGILVAVTLSALVAGCGSSTALDRASDDVKEIVADIEAAPVHESYRFNYSAISPLFMACMSEVEDVEGVVDGEAFAMVLETVQRPGDVYVIDGAVFVHRDLLGAVDGQREVYARIPFDGRAATASRIGSALGTALSVFIAGGARPNHPTETVRALLPVASSMTSLEAVASSRRSIRLVLDGDAYAAEVERVGGSADEVPPIIDVHVNLDGTIQRLVVRVPDAEDATTLEDHSEGYAMDFDYHSPADVSPPDSDASFDLDPEELPLEPTPIPC